jgi:hypothetical protein
LTHDIADRKLKPHPAMLYLDDKTEAEFGFHFTDPALTDSKFSHDHSLKSVSILEPKN